MTTSKSDALTNSLIAYIEDVKPYHTKFRDVSSQLFFGDSFNVNISEDSQMQFNLQNMWTIDDVGGYLLNNISEGATASAPVLTGNGPGNIGLGNGTILNIKMIAPVIEQWTLSAVSSTIFSVVGSISGVMSNAIVGSNYNNAIISFIINAGTKAFEVGDVFTFNVSGAQSYLIPDAIFPRFSLNDNLNFGQTPYGTDPASLDITNLSNGIPAAEASWTTTAGNFVIGNTYTIVTLGTTDFTLIGAPSNTEGLKFKAGLPWTSGPDPTTGTTGVASLKTPSHQIAWYDMIPVEADIISASQVGSNFEIVLSTEKEIIYGFDPSSIQITINGILYPSFSNVHGTPAPLQSTITINTIVSGRVNKIEVLYLLTGRYAVPYHQGCRIRTLNTEQILGTNFVVDRSRSFIQFLPAHYDPESQVTVPNSWPIVGSNIDINLFRSDRLFICWQDPFSYGVNKDSFKITVVPSPGLVYAGGIDPLNPFIIGKSYTILHVGTTDFTKIGAAEGPPLPQIRQSFTMTAGAAINAGSFIIGKSYTIETVSTTNFIAIGASSNESGVSFIATGAGLGLGTAFANYDVSTGDGIAAPEELMSLSIPLSEMVSGYEYVVLLPDPNLSLIGSTNIIGSTFTSTTNGTVKANSLVIGVYYVIDSIGDTNFILAGAPINSPGIPFIATGVTTGTGTASLLGSGLVAPATICNVDFINTQARTNKAILKNATVNSSASIGDVWNVEAIGPWKLSVQKTTSSKKTTALFKTPYDDGVLSFIIDRAWINYYVNSTSGYYSYFIEQDINSYLSYDELVLGTSDDLDPSEFFSDLSIKTEHGDVGNTNSTHPVRFDPFGVVKKLANGSYVFEFDTIPAPYTYIEFKVEQEGQYNPWVDTSIVESAYIAVTYQDTNKTEFITLTGPKVSYSVP